MTGKMSAEGELEQQLKKAGDRLLQPPSPDELLPLLDQVENILSRVEQSPAKSMQAALSPLTNALVTDELLRHANVDVKIAVASCISEITRITAPDAPYDDDKMKEIFQLIVSSFEGLSDESSRSYNKRAMILETVAKVRSCVVMLDLECDGLIAEMFQLFLGTIRDYHPENIFSSMETIMTLVLEESEDISPEILTLLLTSVKKDNQEVLPVAVKLAEKVFENCAVKLKPYLSQAVKSLGVSLDDYSEVVAAVCEGSSSTVEHTNENASTVQLVGKNFNEVCSEDVDNDANKYPKLTTLNGGDDLRTDCKGTGAGAQFSVNAKDHDLEDEPSSDKVAVKPEFTDSENCKSAMLESKLEDADKKRERKPTSSITVSESSDTSHIDGGKEVEKLPDPQETCEKDVHGSPRDEMSAEASKSLEKDSVTNLSSPKAPETEGANSASVSLSGSVYDESLPKKASKLKKKELSIQEETPSLDFVSEKVSEGRNDSEARLHRRLAKKAPADATNEGKTSTDVDASENRGGKSDLEAKKIKQLSKKVDEDSNTEDGYSLKRNRDGKKRGHGKVASEGEVNNASAKDDLKQILKSPTRVAKDEGSPEETLRMSSKRKRTADKDKGTGIIEYGDNLVGSKVKVWWPQDRQFYEGVIDSFDTVKKKHKVSYDDGDEEILNLKKQRWKFVDDGSVSCEEQAAETASPDAAFGMQKRKKARKTPESSIMQGKNEVSPRSGAASSGKLKGSSMKSGRKTEDDQKVKERTTKSGGKTENDSAGNAKSDTQRTGYKHLDDFSKTSVKSKDVDSGTPKTKSKQDTTKAGSKLKPDTPKTGIKSRSKTLQGGGDGSANGVKKIKHSSSKSKETGDLKERSKEKSTDLPKTPEGVKVKSSDASKVQENQSVSMKKRRRAG